LDEDVFILTCVVPLSAMCRFTQVLAPHKYQWWYQIHFNFLGSRSDSWWWIADTESLILNGEMLMC